MKKLKTYVFIGVAATSFFLPSCEVKVEQVHSKAIAVIDSKEAWQRKSKGKGKNRGFR